MMNPPTIEALKIITRAIPQPIVRTRLLTVEDLESLQFPLKVQGDYVILEHSLRGYKLRHPVTLGLEKVLAVREKGLVAYILTAFIGERPARAKWFMDNAVDSIRIWHSRKLRWL